MSTVTTDTAFKTDVLDSDIPVLVDFWAPWCAPCRMVTPILDNIEKNAEGKVKVFKCNVDENPNTASLYRITAIPTIILFKNGDIFKQFVGVQPESVYKEALGM